MDKKPFLISLASYTEGVDRYIDSLRNLEDSVEWLSIEFKPWFRSSDGNLPLGYLLEEPYPNHLFRFDYIPEDLDEDRWWIFTDTADVIFQAPIPDLDETGFDIIVCPEWTRYRDNGFWTGIIGQLPLAKRLLDTPIYNMGCWAMKGKKAKEMLQYLKDNRESFGNHPNCDQLLYNLWLLEQDHDVHPTLFTCLYDSLNKNMTFNMPNGFTNPFGDLYSIVHANGSTKELL